MRALNLISWVGLTAGLAGGSPAVLAQSPAADAPWARLQGSSSASLSRYHEPSIGMRLQGPELGLHLRVSDLRGLPRLQLEADVLGGAQTYSSRDGRLNERATFDARGRVLYQLLPTQADRGLYAGLAYQHSYTDLRGSLKSGTVRGYERENRSLWLALQWRQGLQLAALPRLLNYQLDLGHMLEGRQHSHLSQVGSQWREAINKQPWGWYAQLQSTWAAERGLTLEPFVRYTQVGKSDTVQAGGGPVLEPANSRWQLGLKATWPPN